MLNTVVLCGRIKEIKEAKAENGRDMVIMTLAVPRYYKNTYGEYETDFIDIMLFGNIGTQTKEWCKAGDSIGIKGRIETRITTNEEGFANGKDIVIIAERVSFLSSKRDDINEDN